MAKFVVAILSILSLAFHQYYDTSAPRVEKIPITTGAEGPESLSFDTDGEGPYTGVSDGRILKWQNRNTGWLEYAVVTPSSLSRECRGSHDVEREHLCGRPLGLQFHEKTRNLYVADAYFGLMVVRPGDKFAKQIATKAEEHPFMFLNGLDIDQMNDIVYFTDSSMLFQKRDFLEIYNSHDNTGRLIKYDIRTNKTQVLLNGLSFANGVALSEDASFLVVVEMGTNRITRYWINSGLVEVIAELAGSPDNIKRSARGGFWIAVHASDRTGKEFALRISEEGDVLEEIDVFGSEVDATISEVQERNNTLWIGSAFSPYVATYTMYE